MKQSSSVEHHRQNIGRIDQKVGIIGIIRRTAQNTDTRTIHAERDWLENLIKITYQNKIGHVGTLCTLLTLVKNARKN